MNIFIACTSSLYIVVVQLLNLVWLFEIPWTAACQASVSFTILEFFRLVSIMSVMPSNHLILLLLLSIFPSIRVFSNESALQIKWPKYWSFSFSINLSSEYSGLISFRIDRFYLLAVQRTLKSLLQPHSIPLVSRCHSMTSRFQKFCLKAAAIFNYKCR